jgi:hypothetical protein
MRKRRTPLNRDPTRVTDVWQHYKIMRDSLVRLYEQTRYSRAHNLSDCHPRFFAMDAQDIEESYQKDLEETDAQACLLLIAAAEAAIMLDFVSRVELRQKGEVNGELRHVFRRKCKNIVNNVNVGDHVLTVWAKKFPTSKACIGNFKGALHYRHWLAHGRWQRRDIRQYHPAGILDIIHAVFESIGLTED